MVATSPPTDVPKYTLPVDKDNKATEVRIHNFSRPHMRAFHFAWMSFFLSFFAWFAINPMIVYVRVSIGLCENGGWDVLTDPRQCICGPACNRTLQNGNIINVVGAICMRLFMGTWVENSGPRFSMAFIVILFALPVAGIGLVTSSAGFLAARFFIGGIGSSFVVCQFWSSVMFSKNVVGSANATVGGWGNLGGGVTQIVMSQMSVGLSAAAGYNRGWRYACLVPAGLLVMIGILVMLFSDDVPEGKFKELFASGRRKKQNYSTLILNSVRDPRVWLLCFIYGGCFGTEVAMNQQLAPYFYSYFGLSITASGWAAAGFGLMNLFARSFGGMISDFMNANFGHRARHWVLFCMQLGSGLMLLTFSRMQSDNFTGAIIVLLAFSFIVQMAEGATFSIVPMVGNILQALGPVSGIVGAGGNVGAAIWGVIYREVPSTDPDPRAPFLVHGFAVLGTCLLVPFLHYNSLGSMFFPATEETVTPAVYKPETPAAQTPTKVIAETA
ncbi:major facilitator superfamily domain-containing protein [Pavlovales sp. CCMP2436]|nr:major facilitator superfamily domain-containing protein [Pavlovales sp. CCMP2436]